MSTSNMVHPVIEFVTKAPDSAPMACELNASGSILKAEKSWNLT